MGRTFKLLVAAMLTPLVIAYCGCADLTIPLPLGEDREESESDGADESGQPEVPDEQSTSSKEVPDEEDAAPDAAQPAESCVFVDTNGNRLDYGHAAQFLSQGGQSYLSPDHIIMDIRSEIGALDTSIESVGVIFDWKQRRFLMEAAGGEYVGRLSAAEIMQRGTLTGCHDHGLILASVLREYGFPSVMVDAAGIQWALDYAAGDAKGFSGHIFVEVLTDEGWILVDSTSGQYVSDYELCEPVIPLPKDIEPRGYYAILKGLDPEGYGVESIDDLKGFMLALAEEVQNTDLSAPSYDVRQLPK